MKGEIYQSIAIILSHSFAMKTTRAQKRPTEVIGRLWFNFIIRLCVDT